MTEDCSLEYQLIIFGPFTPYAEMFLNAFKFCDKNQGRRKQRNRSTVSAMCFVNSVPSGPVSGAEFSYLGNGTSDLNSDLLRHA